MESYGTIEILYDVYVVPNGKTNGSFGFVIDLEENISGGEWLWN